MPLAATTVVCYDSNLSMLSVTLDDHTQIFFVIVTMNRLIRVRVALEDRVKRAHFCFLKSAAALIRFFFLLHSVKGWRTPADREEAVLMSTCWLVKMQ
jgi:hypothetical protein